MAVARPIFPTLAVSPIFVQQPSLSVAFYYECLSSFYTPRAISFAGAGNVQNLTVHRSAGRTTRSDILRCIRTLDRKSEYNIILLLVCL